jgi:release factor glutamine methyltransferase
MSQTRQPPARDDDASWTILKLLSWTTDYFAARHIEHSRADAEILLADCLCLRRIDLYVQYDKPLTREELARYRGIVKRRAAREPVAYITGEKEFWSLGLKVTPAVLIPRPETECLVEACLAALSGDDAPRRVLDLGTGSGAIILAIASERSQDTLFAVDRSREALAVANENAFRYGLDQRVRFLEGDWFSPLEPSEPAFDLIVSNPPYIRHKDMAGLQPEILGFEPAAALDGGPDGTDCLAHIIETAPRYLGPGGYLLMEMGYDQRPLLEPVAAAAGCYEAIEFLKDYSGLDRVVKMRKIG